MSIPSGPHDLDCQCFRCEQRRTDVRIAAQQERTRKVNNLHYELNGLVRAFLESKSIKALAEAEPDFEWWVRSLTKKLGEIDVAEK